MLDVKADRKRKAPSDYLLSPSLCGSPGISKGNAFSATTESLIHAVLDPPVHDIADERAGEKAQQLQAPKDGGVEPNWAGWEGKWGQELASPPTSSGEEGVPK